MIGDDDLDRLLAPRDPLVPSDAFTAAVMTAVARETSAPAPIPFPWWRVLLGLAALATGVGAAAVAADARVASVGVDAETLARAWWIGLALLFTSATVRLSSWFTDPPT